MQFGPKVNFRAGRQEGRKDTYTLYISSKKDLESLIKFFSNEQIIPLRCKDTKRNNMKNG